MHGLKHESVVPFPDRVMHHAIMNVLEPVFERQFIFHTYACRKGKGTHAATRCLELLFCVIDSYKIDFEGDVRYMDDMVIFGDSIKELKRIFDEVERFCLEKLTLFLKVTVFGKTFFGVSFLGWRITKDRIFLLSKIKRRMKNRLKEIQKAFERGKITDCFYCTRSCILNIRSRHFRFFLHQYASCRLTL